MCSFDYIFFWNISNSAFLLEKWTEKKSIKKRKENNRDQPISLTSVRFRVWIWIQYQCVYGYGYVVYQTEVCNYLSKKNVYILYMMDIRNEMKCFKIHKKKRKKKILDMWIYYYAHNLCLLLLLLLSILKNSWQD